MGWTAKSSPCELAGEFSSHITSGLYCHKRIIFNNNQSKIANTSSGQCPHQEPIKTFGE